MGGFYKKQYMRKLRFPGLAIPAGGTSVVFAKCFSEIACAGKTNGVADFQYGHVGGFQKLCGLSQPQFRQILDRRFVETALENGAAACFSDPAGIGYFFEFQLFTEIVVQKGNHIFQYGQIVIGNRRRSRNGDHIFAQVDPYIKKTALDLQFGKGIVTDFIYVLNRRKYSAFPDGSGFQMEKRDVIIKQQRTDTFFFCGS